ncbi:MAG: adenosine kinase [Halobacteriovorax sp.]|nr:adenosine kinase [Halobacteriovorax sp.]|tara:strand:+ start:19421 stop:20413 length:993 start_codon:yes stop_codon:yes gene_type:complete
MKKHHVYGIGNALVDMEIEVETDFLEQNGIEKGVMTLVEEERQHELLKKASGLVHKRSCGGSAANTMIAISHLGGRGFYSCKVASDETGDFYFADLVESGVQTNLHGERESGITGKCMVFITPDADRTMNTFLGITQNFSNLEIIKDELADSEWLYIEGYLVTSPTGKAAAIEAYNHAKANGVKTAITLSDPGMVEFFGDGIKEMMGDGVDLLFCNEDEAKKFSSKETVEEALEDLKKVASTIAITEGSKGALLFDGEKTIRIETKKVKAIDTNGAGDLFAGSFLYALTNNNDFKKAGELACACASELVTHFGARLKRDKLETIKSVVLD